jgi:hypothetical protein
MCDVKENEIEYSYVNRAFDQTFCFGIPCEIQYLEMQRLMSCEASGLHNGTQGWPDFILSGYFLVVETFSRHYGTDG